MSAGTSTLIVSALVRREAALLLVEQQGPSDAQARWMLPGGRVEPNETLLDALERELAQETGLALVGLPQVAFAVELVTDAGRHSALTFDCQVDGALGPHDPDGFVQSAQWVLAAEAVERLRLVEWYDCIPIERYLSGEASPGSVYRMEGT